MKTKYCIQWENNRFETHTGPVLMTQPKYNPFAEQLVIEALDMIKPSRPKTYAEAQDLATSMNNSPEFHNQSHKVVVYKGKKRADKPAPIGATVEPVFLTTNQINWRKKHEGFTPVFLLPSAKIGRPRVTA